MKFLKALFLPPKIEGDENRSRVAIQINAIVWTSFFLVLTLLVTRFLSGGKDISGGIIILLILLGTLMIILAVLKLRRVKTASFLFVTLTWAIFIYQSYNVSGIRDTTFVATIIPILLAGLLIDYRFSIGMLALTIAAGWWLASLEAQGLLAPRNDLVTGIAQDYSIIFTMIGLVSVLIVRNLTESIKRANANAINLSVLNADLRKLQAELEQRVEDRTAELELVSLQTQQRANQLAAISEVAKNIATAQEIETLFNNITNAITEQFGYYHTGIFLLDENREYAILRATNSEGGKKMLEKGHRLRVGAQGIVGYVALTNQPRIALDTGVDAVFFNNPDLPLTHSELAVPLQTANKIIGVLDVQSEVPNGFTEEDLALVSTLANQIAVAIENARLFEETRAALKDAQEAYSRFVQGGWAQMQTQMENIGYEYSRGKIDPLTAPLKDEHVKQTLLTGEISTPKDPQLEHRQLAIPVKLRDEVIGVIKISQHRKDAQISTEDITIIRTISERMALALENARLLNDSQRRATRERALAQSTARIGSSLEYETIMLSAVEELNRLIGDSEIVFQLKK